MTKRIIFLAFSIVVGMFLAGNNLKAEFGPIDDHEVVNWLGADRKILLSEIPQMLKETELGRFGKYARYRPSYYTLRIGESYLWGGNASLWYMARIVMFVVAIYLTLLILSSYVWWPVALFGVLHILEQNYWGDILSRLGPSEIYSVLGLPMYIYGLIRIWNPKSTNNRAMFIMYFVGFVICVGAKENFSFLLIPTLLLSGRLIKEKRMSGWRLAGSIAMIGYVTTIFASIAINTLKTSSDIYGADVSIASRLIAYIDSVKNIIDGFVTKPMFFSAIAAMLLILAYIPRERIYKLFMTSIRYAAVAAAFLLVGASQHVYYGAIFPTNIRYDFPILVIPTILIIILTKYLVAATSDLGLKIARPAIYLGTLIAIALLIQPTHYLETRTKSIQNVEMTTSFMGKLRADARRISENPSSPLIINSERPIDYEMISSLQRFLVSSGVNSPVYLRYISNPDLRDSTLGQLLDDRLRVVADQGSSEYIRGFTAYNDQLIMGDCYSILVGEVESESCVNLSRY